MKILKKILGFKRHKWIPTRTVFTISQLPGCKKIIYPYLYVPGSKDNKKACDYYRVFTSNKYKKLKFVKTNKDILNYDEMIDSLILDNGLGKEIEKDIQERKRFINIVDAVNDHLEGVIKEHIPPKAYAEGESLKKNAD